MEIFLRIESKILWNENKLTNQTLLSDLPARPGPNHNGGKWVRKE